jgi:hypothetical protein
VDQAAQFADSLDPARRLAYGPRWPLGLGLFGAA